MQKTQERWVQSWVRKNSWRSKWQTTPIFLLENLMDRGAWWARVHGVTRSPIWLSTHTESSLYGCVSKFSHFCKAFCPVVCGGSDSKEYTCSVGDLGLVPGLGSSPGERNSYPLQYSVLDNSMDREDRRATVHGVTNSWIWLGGFHFCVCYLTSCIQNTFIWLYLITRNEDKYKGNSYN